MANNQQIEEWYEMYSQDIYHFLVYYNRTHDVDDLLQDVFIKAHRNLKQFKGEASPKTWLITIARRLSIDRARKQKLKKWLPIKEDVESEQTISPEQQVVSDERDDELYTQINSLKPHYRDVVIYRGVMELTAKETAEILGWDSKKVDVTFHRAKQKLRTLLEGQRRDLIEKG
ncbi:RNA polymerase sigma factor [Aquisalibacillus elongatus]|uniref:RNA polymerase sigma-70 factor (ECF subfamily) n=1 Tax=Aquisalibacillus elongatus TaxID=485577 RepID=A0A3N5BU97_9BACI|nr:RNA polymerase sigma factor [Aquisalibacillus elongatus]RPF53348.1 RNA polymerase sigma-70 factor (ECF subfamily) [Aquisalibacillus elongatus]